MKFPEVVGNKAQGKTLEYDYIEVLPLKTTDAEATDEGLIALWLQGRSKHTVRAYSHDIQSLRSFLDYKPLRLISLSDLHSFADTLTGENSSKGRVFASIKSLLSHANKLGAIPFNVGAMFRKPAARDTLADRILSEPQVQRMLEKTEGRDHLLVRLAYAGGLRVSELVGLRWKDLAEASDGAMFVTVFGKGGKTRTIRISKETAELVNGQRDESDFGDDFLFGGYKSKDGTVKRALTTRQASRRIAKAAQDAGIKKNVSPYFLRHSHASHALERGAKVMAVRDTLGHSSISVTDRYAHARPGESSGDVLAV